MNRLPLSIHKAIPTYLPTYDDVITSLHTYIHSDDTVGADSREESVSCSQQSE